MVNMAEEREEAGDLLNLLCQIAEQSAPAPPLFF
jgi:hypothetical protein